MAFESRSRRIALAALLVALAAVLDLAVSVPAPFADFLFYEFWEVPVVVALLLLRFWGGVTVATVNTFVLEAVKPGALPTGPFYNLVAEFSMFVGILAAKRASRSLDLRTPSLVAVATLAGAVVRTLVLTLVNGIVLPMPYPFGFGSFGVTQAQVPGLLILIGVFNFTLALYTIPLAFSIERAVIARYRFPAPRPKSGDAGA